MKTATTFGAFILAISFIIQPIAYAEETVTAGSSAPVDVSVPSDTASSTDPVVTEPQTAPDASTTPAIPADISNENATDSGTTTDLVIAPVDASATAVEASTTPAAATTTPVLPTDGYVPGQLLVKFRESKVDLDTASGEAKAAAVADAQGGEVTKTLPDSNIVVISTDADPVDAAAALKHDPTVEYAQPNYIYKTAEVSTNANDTYWGQQWALQNRGQVINGATSTPDSDIDAQEAWQLSQGDDVVVAVIDTGVALTHPDLVNNLWDGSACVDENGDSIEGGCPHHGYDFGNNTDDGNGNYIDDNDPTPDESHGTHVAGIIAAAANDGIGIAGVAPKAKIMAVRADTYYAGDGWSEDYFTDENLIQAIDFARQNHARIINASWGGPYSSKALYDAIKRFGDAGGIFIAAAGNDGYSNDYYPSYPASYNLPNIVSVAATDDNDQLAYFSNYGETTVHVAAPGVDILSTVPAHESDSCVAGAYACYSGTSMAAPHVAGIAALLLAYKPSLTVAEMKDAIVDTGDPIADLNGLVLSSRRVNAFNALASVATVPVTGTVTLTTHIVNDSGRSDVLSDFGYSIDHGAERRFPDATTTLNLAPGVYDLTPYSNDNYTATSTGCSSITVVVGGTYTCDMTFDDRPDTIAPELYLMGDNPMRVRKGTAYVEDGVWVYDDLDGYYFADTSGTDLDTGISVTIDASGVNTNVVGTYHVLYTATDQAGNTATTTRTVNVRSAPRSGGGGGGGGSHKPPATDPGTPSTPTSPSTPGAPSTGPIYYPFPADLRSGASGNGVLELQKRLVAAGYLHVAPTGWFGPLTLAALIQYQLAHGLPGTGFFGPLTRAAMNASH